ncbi:MAG: alanine racemase [Actinomycetota bacterium]|nr:alanine racemase [Actinomycetota bacterium]
MPLTLHVEGERWRAHLRAVADTHPGLVPVAKGNGYGLGLPRLARKSGWLGVDTLAVGTYAEVPTVLSRFDGDVLVMTPWRRELPAAEAAYDQRVVHTLSRVADVAALAAHASATGSRPRVVVEGLTSMARHGLTRHELSAAASALGRLRLVGFALHLPMAGANLPEAEQWAAALQTSQLDTDTLFVSHLHDAELTDLAQRRPGLTLRPRIGTSLWLGDRSALRVGATVLDRHQVQRGERIGYRQRPMPRAGTLVIVAGGTAHGIGLAAPAAMTNVRQRAVSLARGGLEAAGFSLSPFRVGGRQRWFAEPPHMQASMLFVTDSGSVPDIGAELEVDVRYTTTYVDAVLIG